MSMVRQFVDFTQISIGDQLTCKVIRGAKRWRESDISSKDHLEWALEVPGE